MGTRALLRVVKWRSAGWYLDAAELGEVLLPGNEGGAELAVGSEVEVFLYCDSGDRPIATRRIPIAMPGEIAKLRCVEVNDMGAFLDWGLPKQLLVPFSEQRQPFRVGHDYVVRVLLDETTGRFIASPRLARFMTSAAALFREGDVVQALLWGKSPLGYKAVVNGRFNGLIFANQAFRPLKYAEEVTAYVLAVRDDGKLDLSLEPQGRDRIDQAVAVLRQRLESEKTLPFGDDTPAEVVVKHLQMSKKTFKQAIGRLYRLQLIDVAPQQITWRD